MPPLLISAGVSILSPLRSEGAEAFRAVKSIAEVKTPGPYGQIGISYGGQPHDGFGRQPWDLVKSVAKKSREPTNLFTDDGVRAHHTHTPSVAATPLGQQPP